MNELVEKIADFIESHGPIDVAQYMTLANSHPTLGYYPTKADIGTEGDFLTAPEASQIFGELIGAWTASIWMQMGHPTALQLIELGPGHGTMLHDFLRATKSLCDFHQSLSLQLIETSPSLRSRQRDRLRHHSIQWHESLEAIEGTSFRLVIGNEFLDTLPIKQLQRVNGHWHDRLIGLDDERALAFMVGAGRSGLASHLPGRLDQVEEGIVIELAPAREAYVDLLCDRLAANGGVALLIDYGDTDLSVGDSLQAIANHSKVGVLDHPGEADLTSRVTFAPLMQIASRHNLNAWGPLNQGTFLERLGAWERLEALCQRANASQRAALYRGVERIVSADAMGDLFKVIVLTSLADIPPGFRETERWPPCG